MVDRELLDLHYIWFPPEGPWVWRVIKSEDRLAEERLAREVEAVKKQRVKWETPEAQALSDKLDRFAMKVNRSERRAATSPAPLLPVEHLVRMTGQIADRQLELRRRPREAQVELFGFVAPDVGVDGKRRR